MLVLVYLVTICRYAHGDAYKEKTKSIIIKRWRKRTRKQVAKTVKMQWRGESEKEHKYLSIEESERRIKISSKETRNFIRRRRERVDKRKSYVNRRILIMGRKIGNGERQRRRNAVT